MHRSFFFPGGSWIDRMTLLAFASIDFPPCRRQSAVCVPAGCLRIWSLDARTFATVARRAVLRVACGCREQRTFLHLRDLEAGQLHDHPLPVATRRRAHGLAGALAIA